MAEAERSGEAPSAVSTCYRHPDRETYVSCTRCERLICPDCMRTAAVGFHCLECVREGNRTVRQARTVFGGQVTGRTLVTYALIAINVVAYLAEVVTPQVVDRFANLGVGLTGPDGELYVHQGAFPPGFTEIGVAAGEWYRLLTSAFLHLEPTSGMFGILHIVLNMYWLWILGRTLEELLGPARFLAVYLLSALGGGVMEFVIAPEQSSVGASGAVFGIAACYFVLSRRMHHDPLGGGRIMIYLLIWLVVSAGISSWQGHLGGLLAGGLLGLVMAYAPANRRTLVQSAGAAAVLVVLIAATAVNTVMLTG